MARRLSDDQTAVEVLEQASGTLLARTVLRQFLDLTVRPNGTVLAITRSGLQVLYAPTERLAWLRRSAVAPLLPDLQQKYPFD